ncbi:hypothetical protein PO124_34210 [Bacillus licheniformis]|nr:hypothetical protein [Bacillus licheniformis]
MTASVSVADGGSLVSKEANKRRLCRLEHQCQREPVGVGRCKVTDTPDTNQILAEDSFKVYQAKYDEKVQSKTAAEILSRMMFSLRKARTIHWISRPTMQPANNHLS